MPNSDAFLQTDEYFCTKVRIFGYLLYDLQIYI
jgi:hypothetical protein